MTTEITEKVKSMVSECQEFYELKLLELIQCCGDDPKQYKKAVFDFLDSDVMKDMDFSVRFTAKIMGGDFVESEIKRVSKKYEAKQ